MIGYPYHLTMYHCLFFLLLLLYTSSSYISDVNLLSNLVNKNPSPNLSTISGTSVKHKSLILIQWNLFMFVLKVYLGVGGLFTEIFHNHYVKNTSFQVLDSLTLLSLVTYFFDLPFLGLFCDISLKILDYITPGHFSVIFSSYIDFFHSLLLYYHFIPSSQNFSFYFQAYFLSAADFITFSVLSSSY